MDEIEIDVIKAPKKIEKSIYRSEFRYIPTAGSETKELSKYDNSEIEERLKGNIMEVGKPDRWNLKKLCERKEIKLSAEIDMLCEEFDFWLIQSAFSFMPAKDNQFVWGRIEAIMEPLSKGMDDPITFDAYPKNIFQEKEEKHQMSIGLNLKFAEIIGLEAKYIKQIEFTRIEPIVTVAGIGKSIPIWNFSDKAAFDLKNTNSLYVIMKTPIGSDGIKVSYYSFAQIDTKWGGIIPVKTEKKGDKESYEIKF